MNPYGARACVNVSTFLPPNTQDLGGCSLIIPEFTRRQDIPSGEEPQRMRRWLWNTYTHPRYFGLLDLDMELGEVQAGTAPLFTDGEVRPYKEKGEIKQAFAARLTSGITFGDCVRLCPAFARLYRAVQNLLAYLEVPGFGYFSGGGGFRVLFMSEFAWRTVTWGTAYAQVFYDTELRPLIQGVAPELEEEDLDILMASTDKNIYDCDKGTKPDILAHFDTHIFPHPVDNAFEASTCSTTKACEELRADIRAFWVQLFSHIPDQPPTLDAPVQKPPIYMHTLYLPEFPKCKVEDGATHFVLMGNTSSYRKVTDTQRLYELLIAQKKRGEPLNWHELRTPITRHFVDYDGGPALHVPMVCADGTWQTPLAALQAILHEEVLAPDQEASGILLTCPPRADSVGDRAHLIWPGVFVRLTQCNQIMTVLRAGMNKRWRNLGWESFIESPLKRRGCFADKQDKETGEIAHRPLMFEGEFGPDGTLVEEMVEPTDMELLECSSTRQPDLSEADLTPLRPLPDVPVVADTMSGATIKDLPPLHKDAVDALMKQVLATIRAQHDKPKAKYYGPKIHDKGDYRHIECGILEHHQCAPTISHGDNNVKVRIYMDSNRWDLICRRGGCPQGTRPHPTWGRGNVDTTALRVAWPREGMFPPPPPPLRVPQTPTDTSLTMSTSIAPSTPPPLPEPEMQVTLPQEHWDGRYVLVPESSVPGTWASVSLVHAARPDSSLTLPWQVWAQAKLLPWTVAQFCPMRLVLVTLLLN
jgi:hypothetical protein